MTDHPHAEPTPEAWFVQDHPHAYGDIEVVIGDDFKIYIPLMATDWDDAKRSRMRDHADLIAAAPETAAERDKLAGELRHVDAVLARRLALDDKSNRIAKIMYALLTAAERDRLLKVLDDLVIAIDDLVSESNGVDGLHLNGDVAPWSELLPGGQYESWLAAIDPARAALAEARKS